MRFVILSAIFLLLFSCTTEPATSAIAAQVLTEDCPPEGETNNERLGELNKLKNRGVAPGAEQIDSSITLKRMLEPGDDRKRWNTAAGADRKSVV